MIASDGRLLVYTEETYDSDFAAADAAKAYRTAFWALGREIDHRMGACI